MSSFYQLNSSLKQYYNSYQVNSNHALFLVKRLHTFIEKTNSIKLGKKNGKMQSYLPNIFSIYHTSVLSTRLKAFMERPNSIKFQKQNVKMQLYFPNIFPIYRTSVISARLKAFIEKPNSIKFEKKKEKYSRISQIFSQFIITLFSVHG